MILKNERLEKFIWNSACICRSSAEHVMNLLTLWRVICGNITGFSGRLRLELQKQLPGLHVEDAHPAVTERRDHVSRITADQIHGRRDAQLWRAQNKQTVQSVYKREVKKTTTTKDHS